MILRLELACMGGVYLLINVASFQPVRSIFVFLGSATHPNFGRGTAVDLFHKMSTMHFRRYFISYDLESLMIFVRRIMVVSLILMPNTYARKRIDKLSII